MAFALSCHIFILSYLVVVSYYFTRLFFSVKSRKGVDPEGKRDVDKMGGVEGGEIICLMRKDSTFKNREKEKIKTMKSTSKKLFSYLQGFNLV